MNGLFPLYLRQGELVPQHVSSLAGQVDCSKLRHCLRACVVGHFTQAYADSRWSDAVRCLVFVCSSAVADVQVPAPRLVEIFGCVSTSRGYFAPTNVMVLGWNRWASHAYT